MAEWFKAADLKSVDGKTSVGSKPTYAAIWPVSQEVKMLPFHGGDIGSIPVRVTLSKIKYCEVFEMKTEDWISVKTDLPPIVKEWGSSDTVWVFDERCGQREGYLDGDGHWCDGRECWDLDHVTHWMKLPKDPPKEKTE